MQPVTLPSDDTTLFRLVDDEDRIDDPWLDQVGIDRARGLLRSMARLRRLDERLLMLHRQGRVGFHGSTLGQEALPAALGTALSPDDWIVPALRESGVLLERGMPLNQYLAQSFGVAIDALQGRQMPSHQASAKLRVASWSSSVGSQLPHAVGLAWAAKHCRDPVVAVGALGDGATSTADFHAALNFAGVFKVPCLFVCQNNQYAISVPVARQTGIKALSVKARAYGMRGRRVDGNDVLALHVLLAALVASVRNGDGPVLLECVTYRMGPHSSSDDPSRYRTEDEIELWQRRDPIQRLFRALLARELVGESTLSSHYSDMDRELDEALGVLQHAGPPQSSTLFDDVYQRRPWHLNEQRAALLTSPRRSQ